LVTFDINVAWDEAFCFGRVNVIVISDDHGDNRYTGLHSHMEGSLFEG
jgi:hypothetical protein